MAESNEVLHTHTHNSEGMSKRHRNQLRDTQWPKLEKLEQPNN